jgi:hypothetical protein
VTEQPEPEDTCRPVDIDGETIRVRGSGDLTDEGQEALAALVRVAKAKFVADAPEKVGELQGKLRLAHKARRAKEHQLDDIRRALCDIGFMQDNDPYSHADLADVIRQAVPRPSGPDLAVTGPRILCATTRPGSHTTICDLPAGHGDHDGATGYGERVSWPAATEATGLDCSRTTPNNSAEQSAGPNGLPS